MPTEVTLPQCLAEAYDFLFPTIDFNRVHFHVGLPFWVPGGRDGITLSSGGTPIDVYLREYDPCSETTFLTIAHELVHVLQIQEMPFKGTLPGAWLTKYITCTATGELDRGGNCLEDEAYEYANHPDARLRKCIEVSRSDVILPCKCDNIPWLTSNLDFPKRLQGRCPDIKKQKSDCDVGDCLAKLCAKIPVVGCVIGGLIFVVSLFIGLLSSFTITNTGGAIGSVAGALWGAGIGFALGGPIGALVGLVVGFFLGGLIGSFIDWLTDAIGSIIDSITGGGVGSISLLFSSDDGLTFTNKISFERSSEPPALAASDDHLYVGWTGTDDRLNVFAAPHPSAPNTFDRSNDDSGPALLFAFGRAQIVWQDGDNHLHLRSSTPAPSLNFTSTPRIDLGESLGGDVTPALALGNGRAYLAWIDDDERIWMRTSVDGTTWPRSLHVNEKSGTDGTAAIAFGQRPPNLDPAAPNGRLYLAWAGTDDENHINVASVGVGADGSLPTLPDGRTIRLLTKHTLPQRSSDDAGPALAFGNGRLFLAWTDDNANLTFMFTDDPNAQAFNQPRVLGKSSDNAGPALAFFTSANILSIAWIDKG